ncbi:MAG: UPF0182 family protein, partial [Pseudonocardiaceae bacterium]
DSSYPQLAKVLLFYGDRVGYGPSLASALDSLFGTGAGANVVGGTAPPAAAQPPAAGAQPPAAGTGTVSPELSAAAGDIQRALAQLKAVPSGDFAAQATALNALDAAVRRFQAAQPPAPPR